MKPITSNKQLMEEKQRLLREQEALELKIRDNWSDIKSGLRPSALARDAAEQVAKFGVGMMEKDGGIIRNAITVGITTLVQKLSERFRKKDDRQQERDDAVSVAGE